MTKLTKAIKFGMVVSFLEEVMEEKGFEFEGFNAVEFLQDEIALINKRNQAKSENKKPSKNQAENMEVIGKIAFFLNGRQGQMLSAMEISEGMELGYTSQKMSALMKKMVDSGMVLKGKADSSKLVGYGVEVEPELEEEGNADSQE